MILKTAIVLAFVGPALYGITCENLKQLQLGDGTITHAQAIRAGIYVPPGGSDPLSFERLPDFCQVNATLKPSADSDIKIEVWLPLSGWNGKFAGTGNGGYAGAITPSALADVVRRGYAAAATDTGHSGELTDASFAYNHPEKLIDFGYRSAHVMTIVAKALIQALYGVPPVLSYWIGCSTGGRQGMAEAQLYPDDYDGIVAGSAGNNTAQLTIQALAIAQATHRTEASGIPASLFPMIHEAVLAACDAEDGVKDGVIGDPTRCHFDPASLACPSVVNANCLTSAQTETIRTIYDPLRNVRSKQMPSLGLQPGSELGWANMAGAQPFFYANEFWKYMVMNDSKWDYKSLNIENALTLTHNLERERGDAADPNLKPFFSRGGKLLQYQGWADQNVPPMNSVVYYKRVADALGSMKVIENEYRLFMVPGMMHCRGGAGTDQFDMLGALDEWRDKGKPPEQVDAAHLGKSGVADRTRPLCPYPQVAIYNGSGSTDSAANFSCKVP